MVHEPSMGIKGVYLPCVPASAACKVMCWGTSAAALNAGLAWRPQGPPFRDEDLQADEEEGEEEDQSNGQGGHKAPAADGSTVA